MKPFFNKYSTLALMLSLFVFTAGCDSNDDDDIGASFEQMGEMIEKSFAVFGNVAVDILLNPASKAQPIYDCDFSGTVDYSASSAANQYDLIFDDCNGLTGNIGLGLVTNFTENGFDFNLSLNGNLTESCEMTLNNFTMDFSSTDAGDDQISLNGGIASTCNGESFSCTFNDDLLDDTSDDSLFNQRCSGSAG